MTSVNFEVLFGGVTRLTHNFNLCKPYFFFNKKKLQNPKVARWRPFYGLRCGSQRDLRRHFGAQWRAECCCGPGKRTEVGKLKKGQFVGKGTKNRTKHQFLGFPYLSFWRIFFYVSSEERTIFYWLLVVHVFFLEG